jgi:Fur family ferric uptake transcriptional regulator
MKKKHALFESFLIQNDGRYTVQKQEIATAIFKTKGHFEIENFIDDFRSDTRKLSRATVYRTIKQLLDAKLLQKISTRDGKVYYEHTVPQQHHAHVICNHCGKIQEIKDTTINEFINTYCNTLKFTAEYQSLHIYGTCKNCSKK